MIILIPPGEINTQNIFVIARICVKTDKIYCSNFSVNSIQVEKPAEYKLNQMLKLLRISATIHQIPEWSKNEEIMRNSGALQQFTNIPEYDSVAVTDENKNRSKLYMQRCVSFQFVLTQAKKKI